LRQPLLSTSTSCCSRSMRHISSSLMMPIHNADG
jgi:hypothetical protein